MADLRGYVTAAGQQFEALAKQMGYPVEIGMIEIGDGVLPDNESPIARTQLVNKIWSFPASVEQDPKNPGQWVAWIHIPPDHAINGQGYFIREIGCKLINQGGGILYAYRRVSNDWKPVDTSGEAKSFIYKLRFIPGNGELLRPTIDPSVVMVDREELDRELSNQAEQFNKKLSDHEKGRNHPLATTTESGLVRQATDDEAILGQSIDAMMSAKNVADAVKEMLKQMFVGIPLPWPTEVPPDWALSVMGQAINPTTDPLLAARYPSLKLPDGRAEFIRGWDNGRGVDAGRQLLSWMPDSLKAHAHTLTGWGRTTFDTTGGTLLHGMDTPTPGTNATLDFPVSGGGPETAPRSLAFHYITMRG
ncbi:phage tail protein [Aeromonas veronii]|uniref:phage tail protein n=1 Tax=Aeromonas veronii TaxID=654 RepID=UPI002B2981B9|nr:hypothetical protein VAWG002_43660 [Aeromonas veronii]